MDKTDNNKKAVIEALQDCHGIVTDACKKTGVARSTFYQWLNEDADFKAAVEEAQEQAIDFVEGKLFQKINGVKIGNKSTPPPEGERDWAYFTQHKETFLNLCSFEELKQWI